MHEKKMKVWTYNIHYKEYWSIDDQVIFILHWWWGKSDSWMQSWEILSNNNFRVIIPDLPWFWKTKIHWVLTLDDYSLFIENFIKELKIKDFIIWWHSNWWAISIKLTKRWNLDISRLVLNNSAWIRYDNKRIYRRKFIKKITNIFKILLYLPGWKKLRNTFYKIIGSHDYLKVEEKPYLKGTYINMISSDLVEDLKKIKINTLLIWWEKDTYTPVSDWILMKKLIPYSKIATIPDQKHWIHLQNPEILITTFLKNI